VADEADDRFGVAQRKRELRRTLVEYLATCPTAADTLDGIAAFWLPRQRVRTELALLAEVLTELTAEGVLEASGTGDARSFRLRSRSS
jgi:hypothetical protein